MLKNPKLSGHLNLFSSNPNLTSHLIEKYPKLIELPDDFLRFQFYYKISIGESDKNFCWVTISSSKLVSMADLEFFPQIPWNYQGVSSNLNLDIYHLRKFHTEGKKLDWFRSF